jgi:hypothetical protein
MDRPLAPWELEQQAEALAELKGTPRESSVDAEEVAAAAGTDYVDTDPEAMKRAERQMLIQQAERMIADGRGDSSILRGLQANANSSGGEGWLPFIRQHSLAIGVGVLLLTFVILLLVMMNFVGRMASGIAVPTQ